MLWAMAVAAIQLSLIGAHRSAARSRETSSAQASETASSMVSGTLHLDDLNQKTGGRGDLRAGCRRPVTDGFPGNAVQQAKRMLTISSLVPPERPTVFDRSWAGLRVSAVWSVGSGVGSAATGLAAPVGACRRELAAEIARLGGGADPRG